MRFRRRVCQETGGGDSTGTAFRPGVRAGQHARRRSARRPAAPTPTHTPETAKSRYPDAKTRARIDELLARIQDAYFDYDRHNLRPDALKTLESDSRELAEIVRQYPDFKMKVEGYCDERGSAEYNMALGDRRAEPPRITW